MYAFHVHACCVFSVPVTFDYFGYFGGREPRGKILYTVPLRRFEGLRKRKLLS